jgi:hypothetical protein
MAIGYLAKFLYETGSAFHSRLDRLAGLSGECNVNIFYCPLALDHCRYEFESFGSHIPRRQVSWTLSVVIPCMKRNLVLYVILPTFERVEEFYAETHRNPAASKGE